MEQILKELRAEILQEIHESPEPMDTLGTSAHQLKLTLDEALETLTKHKAYDPFELTNRILDALNHHRRLKC